MPQKAAPFGGVSLNEIALALALKDLARRWV
jgi:hypothetical protein